MAEAATPIRTVEPPAHDELDRLFAAWKHAKGRWEMLSYAPECYVDGLPREQDDALCDATADALNAFLLHPVTCPKEFARKMRVFHEEDICDGWFRAHEIVAQLVRDAQAIAFPELASRK